MKTKKITLIITVILLSALIFFLLAHFVISPPLKQTQATLESLQTTQEIYEKDFEKVYSHPNYTIYPKNNLTVVELKENGISLILYYMQDGTFVTSEIEDYDFYTNSFLYAFLWFLVMVLSIALSILITTLGIIAFEKLDQYKRRH